MEIILPIFLLLILRFKSWKYVDCLIPMPSVMGSYIIIKQSQLTLLAEKSQHNDVDLDDKTISVIAEYNGKVNFEIYHNSIVKLDYYIIKNASRF